MQIFQAQWHMKFNAGAVIKSKKEKKENKERKKKKEG